MQFSSTNISYSLKDITKTAKNAFNIEFNDDAIDIWHFMGSNSDLAYGLKHAKDSMNKARDAKVF